MPKVTTKEFVRTEIISAINDRKTKGLKTIISFNEFVDEVFKSIEIDEDIIYSLLSNKESRKEMLDLIEYARVNDRSMCWGDFFGINSYFTKSFKIAMRTFLYVALKKEFTKDNQYPMLSGKMLFEVNKENLLKIESYFKKETFNF